MTQFPRAAPEDSLGNASWYPWPSQAERLFFFFLSQRSFQMVSLCQHTKDRPGCWAHPATPPFLGPHPNLLRFHRFCGVFGNLCTLASPPSVPTNSKVLLQRSLNPQGVLRHRHCGVGMVHAGACGGTEGRGWEAPSSGRGMIFLDFLGLFSVALCSAPRARALGGGNLEAPSRKAFKWVPAGLVVRVPWAWQGPGLRASVRKTLLASGLVGRATRVSRPKGPSARVGRDQKGHHATVQRSQPAYFI